MAKLANLTFKLSLQSQRERGLKGAVQCSGVAVCEEADQGVESGVKGHNGRQVEGAISGDSRNRLQLRVRLERVREGEDNW